MSVLHFHFVLDPQGQSIVSKMLLWKFNPERCIDNLYTCIHMNNFCIFPKQTTFSKENMWQNPSKGSLQSKEEWRCSVWKGKTVSSYPEEILLSSDRDTHPQDFSALRNILWKALN